jgi:hypothetical protein
VPVVVVATSSLDWLADKVETDTALWRLLRGVGWHILELAEDLTVLGDEVVHIG